MKSVVDLIERQGGLVALRKNPIRLEVEGFMPLVIEAIGSNSFYHPFGWGNISVAHYGEQNGDLMRDPEMVFAAVVDVSSGMIVRLEPCYFRNDYVGRENCVYVDCGVHPRLKKELESFAHIWNRNLNDQGFIAL